MLVSNGAYGCLFSLSQALVDKGDEVVIVEPFYDCYINQVILSGGTIKYVPLRATKENPNVSQDWALDSDELKAAFSDKTKMVLINNPNNPLGKVYSESLRHSDTRRNTAELLNQTPAMRPGHNSQHEG